MKTLVTYFSQTGNTGKVAEAIYEVAVEAGEVDLKKIDEIDPAELTGYDFLFVGSPIQRQVLPDTIKEFVFEKQPQSNTRFVELY